ncbi:endo-1,3-1,4-beta glucanase-related protein [Bacteroidia bacterium]|nr:endo-1,3-1,4-beta glucanase-related protein [Bacteroidia bacterium]GHU75706.1 endo-1,3-1,4-beta glucanase-related protein [Bacteroidia bacterium]
MKKVIYLFVSLGTSVCFLAQAQQPQQAQQWDPRSTEWYYPVPPKVAPGQGTKPPSDAIILFDGKDTTKWEPQRGEGPIAWKVQNGSLVIVPGKGGIRTKEYFGDCQLHVEFKSPPAENYDGQNRGNSAIMMHSRYEIQILDGDNNPTYVNGMVGSIYKQSAPLVNAYTKNGEWQVYDIYWKAPVFNIDGSVQSPAMATVVLNGIVVQNNYILKGTTPYTGLPKYTAHGRLPISLQDHGTATEFRNIWIRNL